MTFPANINKIGNLAFSDCENLTMANLLGNAPKMGCYVFENCGATFKVNYIKGKTGFGNPWHGYTAMYKGQVLVKSVKLNKTALTLNKGKTYKLIATISPTKASFKKVTWKSGNRAIATVSSKGIVKGIKKGTTCIYELLKMTKGYRIWHSKTERRRRKYDSR